MKILCLMAFILAPVVAQYQWAIFEQDRLDLCAGSPSCNGRPHTMCYMTNETHPRCRKFQPVVLSEENVKSFMMGHNGLRNKVATNSRAPAIDMQFLHWDRDLQAMAERWVRQCILAVDECDFIGNPSHPVGQNVFFHPKPMLKHWEALALSTWFNEQNTLPVGSSVGGLRPDGVSNYTQLVWAKTQFVGCGAASMYGGYLVVCNYYPKGNIVGQQVFTVGRRPCIGCPQERASCSHVFRGLCGIDDRHSGGFRFRTPGFALITLSTLLLALP